MVKKFLNEAKEQNINIYLSLDKKSAIFKGYD
jgi:hypothetical protein